ncbi:MAG: hypothetical protein GX548_06405 [Lentisphaerae bacterium]|nr:hypothetical protein [Lentisphaerota bacterium]
MNRMGKWLPTRRFTCPNCGAELALEDIHVARDVALCRGCGYSGSFLSASTVPHLSDEEMARPPKRVTLQRGFGDSLTITCKPKRTILFFLVPFVAFWSGISMTMIYIVPLMKGEFEWKMGLFGLPFLAGTVVLAGIILNVLLGKTTVTLSKGRIQVGTHLLGWTRRREFECGQGTTVSLQDSSYRVNNVPQKEIVLSSGGRSLAFGAMGLSHEAKTYVAAVLRRAAGGG